MSAVWAAAVTADTLGRTEEVSALWGPSSQSEEYPPPAAQPTQPYLESEFLYGEAGAFVGGFVSFFVCLPFFVARLRSGSGRKHGCGSDRISFGSRRQYLGWLRRDPTLGRHS